MPEDKPEDSSDIAKVELPINGFSSDIPPYLLEGKSEAEQFILTEVSKMGHFIKWAAPVLVDNNLQARRSNGRLKTLEAFKAMFTSWWGFAGAVLSVIGGIAGVIAVIEFIFKIRG